MSSSSSSSSAENQAHLLLLTVSSPARMAMALPPALILTQKSNDTLQQISKGISRNKESLLWINGIGEATIRKYGDRVLETIEATIKEYYMTDKNSSSGNDSADSVKRRRYTVTVSGADSKDGGDFIESTGPSKIRVLEKQNKSVENFSAKLYSALRLLRIVLLKEAEEPVYAYHIFRNSTLQQISRGIPRNKEELFEINGIHEAKVRRYGDRVLATIEATINEYYTKTEC